MRFETLDHCLVCGKRNLKSYDSDADLALCCDCGYVFANPRPTLESLIEYYSKPAKYDGWLSEEKPREDLWIRRLKKLMPRAKAGSLLDVGTGIGQFLFLAKPYFKEVDGTEVSESAIRLAKEKYQLTIRQGEAETHQFSRTYDNITLFHVLEHVPDPTRLIQKCFSLLNPSGRLFIAVPNDLNCAQLKLKTRISRLRGKSIPCSGIPRIVLDGTVDEIHLSQFTSRSLSYLLHKEGLKIIDLSLDPFFVRTGWKRSIHLANYNFQSALRRLFGINIYNTIWAVAEKP